MRLNMWLMCAAALGITLTAQAEVYKWVDSSGRVFYSDQPPPAGTKAKTVNVKDTAVTSIASQKKATASAASATTPATAKAAATPSAPPPRDEVACAAAQKRLSFLQNAKLFKETNEQGNIEYLESSKKQQEIAEKQDFLAKNCR